MINDKPAPVLEGVNELIKNRWSPLAFSDKEISDQQIKVLLDAARWAASSFNEQPWQYVVAKSGSEKFEKIFNALADGNSWAKNAGVLMVSIAKKHFDHKHKANRHYAHDVGAANALMHLQATDMNLYFHQMAGFDSESLEKDFKLDVNDFEVMTVIAIGYPGDVEALSEDLQKRSKAARSRKGLDKMFWN